MAGIQEPAIATMAAPSDRVTLLDTTALDHGEALSVL
jgi:hypothetical protein